jgi:hypothetical protein
MINDAIPVRRRRTRPKAAPRPMSVRVRRGAALAARPVRRLVKSMRSLPRGYKGVERPPRWHRGRAQIGVARVVTYVGAAALALLVLRSAIVVFGGKPDRFPFGFDPDGGCEDIGYSCGVANSVLITFLTLAFAAAAFLLWRMGRVHRPYVKRARTETKDLVPTAGTILDKVVGRDEICNVIMDDLRVRDGRRPHVLLGGVGVGKTAVLYELTRRLASNGAVPVPIRLRDAQDGGIDFETLAKEHFIAEVSTASVSDAEAERVWRELRKDDQIVVLADGLEEALDDEDGRANGRTRASDASRDNLIHLAMRDARRAKLPLVVASRPHDALVGLDAAIVELEDLGEEAAIEYIEHGAPGHDAHRLDWVIETAEVTDTPLFLEIARQLHREGLLVHARPRRGNGADPTEPSETVDSWELERAARGLDTRGVDRASLRLRLLETWTAGLIAGHFESQLPLTRSIRRVTVETLAALACMGLKRDKLEVAFKELLVRADSDRLRYQSMLDDLQASIVKAKECELAGSKRVPISIERELRLAAARGLQLGLVEPLHHGVRFPHSVLQAYFASRAIGKVIEHDPGYLPEALKHASRELLIALVMYSRRRDPERAAVISTITKQLRTAARNGGLSHAKAIDTLVAALEVDSVADRPQHRVIAAELAKSWQQVSDDRTVEESKLRAIARFGETARTIADLDRPRVRPAYAELFEIARTDLGYRIRLAAAQELGAGGDAAFSSLTNGKADRLAPPADGTWEKERSHREHAVRAWLAPMLAGSTDRCAQDAQENLRNWLRRVSAEDGQPLPLSLQVALAQGFKLAANRRPDHPFARRESRDYLMQAASEMLKASTFWFTRLTLLHAHCLWELPELPTREGDLEEKAGSRPWRKRKEPSRRASDPSALVTHWLATDDSEPEHPFLAEARELAIFALEKRQPERFLWIDESGVVTKIGARPPRSDAVRKHNLWIPPSVGWSALHPRAQKLVADVLLLLNLIERDGKPVEREQRMRRATRNDLPPCLSGEREFLAPSHTVGMVKQPASGTSCKDECPFDLCPYPPKGKQPYRVELSEAFCRRQQVLLGRWWRVWPRRTASWQGALPGDLKRFWKAMEQRARR